MKWAIFLFFLFLIPLATAFDCSNVKNTEYCLEIQNSDIENKNEIYSALFYPESSIPKHDVIEEYNKDVDISPTPESSNSKYIKNAWLLFSELSPSVYDTGLLVPPAVQALSHYDYDVQLPSNYYASSYPQNSNGDCKRTYSLQSNNAVLNYIVNGNIINSDLLYIESSGTIISQLDISVNVKQKHYHWKKYKQWGKWKYTCDFSYNSYDSDSITLQESKDVVLYDTQPSIEVEILDMYDSTTKGKFTANYFTKLHIEFPNSSITKQQQTYSVMFDEFHVATLKTNNNNFTTIHNIVVDDNEFYVKNGTECTYKASNYFYSIEDDCSLIEQTQEHKPLELEEKTIDLSIFIYILLVLFLMYVIFKIIKSQGKKFLLLLFILLLLPMALAEPEEDDDCGISNLGSCLPNLIYNIILGILNAPLIPLLLWIKELFTADTAIQLFHGLWSIVRYILSFFYIFFFLYAGFTFLTSSGNPIKRVQAKNVLRDAFIMIVLIQGSFYMYELLISLGNNMTSSILGFIDPTFFLLTMDNLPNILLQIVFTIPYVLVLLTTTLLLIIRYIIVTVGVVIFPIGIFCYFVPPLRGYGQFIFHLLGMMIFITFLDMLIILACSQILEITFFANIKILVMTACFAIVSYTLWLGIKMGFKKFGGNVTERIGQAVKYLGGRL